MYMALSTDSSFLTLAFSQLLLALLADLGQHHLSTVAVLQVFIQHGAQFHIENPPVPRAPGSQGLLRGRSIPQAQRFYGRGQGQEKGLRVNEDSIS